MDRNDYLTHEDHLQIEANARHLRALALADGIRAAKAWITSHVPFGAAHKA